ncbi:MerR family transcriptional regulator [Geobacter sulfurreducens]|uniref:MerR family transcriptional regulator n=1 Tax=Geobacter sulfurreducens TaxID=35554 RepID=UPI000DBAFC67|nr:MerR family transcriptional regulator [Geobacter sulfurreducens]QVW34566.1 MerR family transcriptional regulator [Geobacter sulfurreducens]BBA71167.1 hypothetical protein YM18_2651 [Geobacter sulfurreducens]
MTIETIKVWCTVEEAVAKFGVERAKLLGWVEDGLVRSEEEKGKVVRLNMDDVELKVEEMTGL